MDDIKTVNLENESCNLIYECISPSINALTAKYKYPINIIIPSKIFATDIIGISYQALAYMNIIKEINISQGIKSINDYAFKDCKNLDTVNIPKSIKHIGKNAFAGTLWLENQRKQNSIVIVNNILIDGQTDKNNVVIVPNHTKSISPAAFKDNKNLNVLSMSNTVRDLGYESFLDCSNLSTILLSEKLKSIGDSVFKNCKRLKYIVLPENIKYISPNAFAGCQNMIIAYNGNTQQLQAVLNSNLTDELKKDNISIINAKEINKCFADNKMDEILFYLKSSAQREYALIKIDEIINMTSDINRKLELLNIRENITENIKHYKSNEIER